MYYIEYNDITINSIDFTDKVVLLNKTNVIDEIGNLAVLSFSTYKQAETMLRLITSMAVEPLPQFRIKRLEDDLL